MRTAFALAGLGGFNAHGAGFLAAATAWGLQPDLVTASSGQILVLAAWLGGEKDLRESLISPGRDSDPIAQLQTVLFGFPGVFQPAYQQTLARLAAFPDLREGPLNIFADRFLPAQQYVPDRPRRASSRRRHVQCKRDRRDLQQLRPGDGNGFLYGNDVARKVLPKAKQAKPARRRRERSPPRPAIRLPSRPRRKFFRSMPKP